MRYNNTIEHRASYPGFGNAAGWRHAYQWDLIFTTEPATGKTAYQLIYPSGQRRMLFADATGKLSPKAGYLEEGQLTVTGATLSVGHARTVTFSKFTLNGKPIYRPDRIHEKQGDTLLSYTDDKLVKITGPSGEWLQLNWDSLSTPKYLGNTVAASILQAPAPRQWLDVSLRLPGEQRPTRQIRLVLQPGAEVAEVQFFAENSTTPLIGKVTGTALNAASAMDGSLATSAQARPLPAEYSTINVELVTPVLLDKARVQAKSGTELALVNSRFRLIQPAQSDTAIFVIKEVAASNGRRVNYSYSTVAGEEIRRHVDYGHTAAPGEEIRRHVGLSEAAYGDGTKATYRYQGASASYGLRALLVEADDPRFIGRAKHLIYQYQKPNDKNIKAGAILAEIDPATMRPWVRLEFDAQNPLIRKVHYSDQRVNTYQLHADGVRVVQKTDSIGRVGKREYPATYNAWPAATISSSGKKIENKQDGKGRSLELTTKDNHRLKIARDIQGRVTQVADGKGRVLTREWSADDKVVKTTNPAGEVVTKTFDAKGFLIRQISSRGTDLSLTYDAMGRRTEIKDNIKNRSVKIGYNQYGQRNRVENGEGLITRYEHNERGLVTKTIKPNGQSVSYDYDSYGRVIRTVNEYGRSSLTDYDILGRKTAETDYFGRTTRYEYSELPMSCGSCTLSDRPTKMTAPDGTTTSFLYDTEGRLLARTSADGTPAQATTTYTYDLDDNILSQTDPLGRTTRYTYDTDKHRLSQTAPDGTTTLWAYDEDGNLLSETAPTGAITRHTYDNLKRRTSTTNALGETTRFKYDLHGNIIQLTDATGKATKYTYDAGKRRTSATCGNDKETWTYTPNGKLATHTNCEGLKTTYTYDARSQVVQTTDTLGRSATYTYDPHGKRISATDSLNRTTRTDYDPLGQINSVTLADGTRQLQTHDPRGRLLTTTDALGQTTTYGYNASDLLETLTDARGSTYRFTYDAFRRKTSMVYPDNTTEKWTYNLVGQPITTTNRSGQTKTTTYNPIDRPLRETWSNPSPITSNPLPTLPSATSYTYDAAGRLISIANGSATLTYTYDLLNRLISETTAINPALANLAPQTVAYSYNKLGRLEKLTYPEGTVATRTYDHQGRLEKVALGNPSQPWAQYAYDAAGRIDSVTRDNGIKTTTTYDLANQLTGLAHRKGAADLAASSYTLDLLGRRTAQTREDQKTETYTYDATSQLTSVDYGTGQKETYAYDATGNRTATTAVSPIDNRPLPLASGTAAYVANNLNQYIQIATGPAVAQPTYDANGNLLSEVGTSGPLVRSYVYDSQNRLIAAETADTKIEFYHDPRNRCILRRHSSKNAQGQWSLSQTESRALTYDTAWNLLTERDLTGATQATYLHGQRTDEILVAKLGTTTVYPLADGLGSTVALTNDKGKVTDRYRYTAYGQPTSLTPTYNPSPLTNNRFRFLFTGREWLNSIQLNDHRNRYYSPGIGRWTATDPIGFKGNDSNIYRYCANAPLENLDHNGLRHRAVDAGTKPYSPVNGTESSVYNCHNFAWSDGTSWSDDPRPLIAASGRGLTDNDPSEVGDIVLLFQDTNGNSSLDDAEMQSAHSMIVTEVDADGYTTRVTGKEGESVISSHHPLAANPSYLPFFSTATFQYYRKNTATSSTGGSGSPCSTCP